MRSATDYWWLPFFAGTLSMIVGVIAIFYPGPTLQVVGLLIGIYLALWGLLAIIRGFGGSVLLLVVGLLAMLTGLVLMVRPDASVKTIALVLGLWWTLTGALRIAAGIALPEDRGINIAIGVIGVIAGVVILAQPKIGLGVLVVVSGIGLLVQGAIEALAGWRLRSEPPAPAPEVVL